VRWTAYDVFVWSGVALLFAAQTATRAPASAWRILAANAASFAPCAIFTPLIVWTSLRFRPETVGRGRAVVAHACTLAAFLVVGGAMMGWFEWALPWKPAGEGAAVAMREAVSRYFAVNVLLYAAVAAAATTWGYAHDARDRSLRATRLQAQLAEAQLHALGSQLQPHFLFNTLHVISALVRPDPRRAEQLIARLSELLREMLDSSDRVEVPLREELRILEKYADIQEARFGPRLRITLEIDGDVLDVVVPRLVLQPLVENAVRHGLAPRSAAGQVVVRASCSHGRLRLTVRDDGVGVAPGGPSREGVGLGITRARLAQLYGDAARLTLEPAPGGGTICAIEMPCSGRAAEVRDGAA
jgi:two-component system, LytTR family, sensor kinase